MQYKLPIISTDEGAVPDIVNDGENGYVCKRQDIISTFNAIEDLLNDTSLQVFQNGIIFPKVVEHSEVKFVRFPLDNSERRNGCYFAYESTSLKDMEEFAKEYLDKQQDSLLREALMKYETKTERTPTFYLDFCIGALDWCRVETIEETKNFYDSGMSLWNFGISDIYRDMGYEIKFVPEIIWSNKDRRYY
jgi:hypothetical protein